MLKLLSDIPEESESYLRGFHDGLAYAASAIVDLSSAIKEGSFNPYGNGQFDNAAADTTMLRPSLLGEGDTYIETHGVEVVRTTELVDEYDSGLRDPKCAFRHYIDKDGNFNPLSTREALAHPDYVRWDIRVAQAARGVSATVSEPSPPGSPRLVVPDDLALVLHQSVKRDLPRTAAEWCSWVAVGEELGPSSFVYAEGDDEIVELATSRKTTAGGGANARIAGDKTAKRPAERTPKEKRLNLEQVARRIANKIHSWDELCEWMLKGDSPPPNLAKAVMTVVLRSPGIERDGPSEWLCNALIERRKLKTTFEGFAVWSSGVANVLDTPEYVDFSQRRFPQLPERVSSVNENIHCTLVEPITVTNEVRAVDADAHNREMHATNGNRRACEAKAHNRLMHALNGNTEAPQNMHDLEQAKSCGAAFADSGTLGGPFLDPVDAVAIQSGIEGPLGQAMANVTQQSRLRVQQLSSANQITLETHQALECHVYAQERRGAAAAVAVATRPRLTGIGAVRRNNLTDIALSEMGMIVESMISKQSNIRDNQIGVNGFRTADTAALIRTTGTMDGDDISTLLLKLELYETSRSFNTPVVNLPSDMLCRASPNTVANGSPVVTFNDPAAAWGLDCGVDTSVFPFTTATPTIAFHAGIATVPPNEPWFFMPPGLLLQADRGEEGLNLALLALALAPYPCGSHTVTWPTVDTAGGAPFDLRLSPLSDLVHMRGVTTLNLVLPLDGASRLPTNQAEANSGVLVRPRSGPAASNGIPADTDLNVCFLGAGGLVTYNLAEFLYTWMDMPTSPIDLTTLTRFRKQLCSVFQRDGNSRFCRDLALLVSTNYGPLVTDEAAPPAASVEAYELQNFFGLLGHRMAADAPVLASQFDFYVGDLNPFWWNKIASGMYIVPSDTGLGIPQDLVTDGSILRLQYAQHLVRQYAVTAEHFFSWLGFPREMWDAAFTQMSNVGIQNMLRGCFTTAARGQPGEVVTSKYGLSLALGHCRITGYQPAVDNRGYTVWDYINAPQVGFCSAYRYNAGVYTALPLVPPTLLTDIWLQVSCVDNYKVSCLMPGPNSRLTGMRLDKGQVIPFGNGDYSVPVPEHMTGHSVGLRTVPVLPDDAAFNARLLLKMGGGVSLFTMDGTVIVAGFSGVLRSGWSPNTVDRSTRSTPVMMLNGRRTVLGKTAAQGAAGMTQVMSGRSFASVGTFLIGGLRSIPNAVVDGGGYEEQIPLAVRPSSKNSLPASEPVSESGEVMQD